MYSAVLGLHNLTRWLVLLSGIWTVMLVWRGWLARGTWTPNEARAVRVFLGTLDFQLLLGLLLYVAFSPLTRTAFGDLAGALRDPPVRYFLVEHVAIMVAAIACAHVGAVRIKRATTDAERFQRASVWMGISLAAVAGFIPWARPLVPSF
jgi:hypothetical protein